MPPGHYPLSHGETSVRAEMVREPVRLSGTQNYHANGIVPLHLVHTLTFPRCPMMFPQRSQREFMLGQALSLGLESVLIMPGHLAQFGIVQAAHPLSARCQRS